MSSGLYSDTVKPYKPAVELLDQSHLTDQLEALDDQIDLTALNLAVDGKTLAHIRSLITSATIERTIQGASTLTLGLMDADLALTTSGVFGSNVTMIQDQGSLTTIASTFSVPLDVELDGLWFRMVGFTKDDTTRELTLTFEDREIAVLRRYPKPADPQEFLIFQGFTRIGVMKWLISEATEFVQANGQTGPRIHAAPSIEQALNPIPAVISGTITPLVGPPAPDPINRGVAHYPGFPAIGPSGVTVQRDTASAAQLANLDAVLSTGYALGVPQVLLIAAVMTVTQETVAGKNVGNDPAAVGLFQQNPVDGWPATGNPALDAGGVPGRAGFYGHAQAVYTANPSMSAALISQAVQRPKTQDPAGSEYGQWLTEAENTVTIWLGNDETFSTPASATGISAPQQKTPFTPTGATIEGTAQFTRGSQSNEGGKTVVTREDNWTCLQRLASEVGWLCYCVSGTIYIETYSDLSQQAVALQIWEDAPGIDSIGFDIDNGTGTATATVACRISRWKVAPGRMVKILDLGPASGKWIVQTVERDLFSTSGTLTLSKPQGTLLDAESASPVQGLQLLTPSGTTTSSRKALASDITNVGNAIAAAALAAVTAKQNYLYVYGDGHTATSLFTGSPDAPETMDCSAFAELCYKTAGAPDPSGQDYTPLGNTDSMIPNGKKVPLAQALPGDLCFYGSSEGTTEHVTVYVGNGLCVSMGQVGDPQQIIADYRPDFLGYYRFNLGPLG